MNSFELNKIIGAILGTLLFVMGVGFVAEAIYAPIEGRGPGYTLPEPEDGHGAEPAAPEAPAVSLGVLLASAVPEQGANAVRKCQSCHNFGEGGANKQGPALYGVVGRVIGSHENFAYSDAMRAHQAAGDIWTYEYLYAFLAAPKAVVPGTKMTFAGVKSPEERANILAYLATLSPGPVPFPPVEDESPAEGAEGPEPMPADAGAVATPTTTHSETPGEGTPTTSGTGGTDTPAATEAPAQ